MKQEMQGFLKMIHSHPGKRLETFLALSEDKRTVVFLQLPKKLQFQILKALSKEHIISLLEALDPDDATDALQLFDPHTQKELLQELSENIQNEIGLLLTFDQKTAGGLMSLDYIQVSHDEQISSVAEKFKLHEKRTGKPPEIIVLRDGKVHGYLPGYQLGFAKPDETVEEYVKPISTMHHRSSEGDVIEQFRSHPHTKLVVLDEMDRIVGIIYSDDVLKVLKDEESASLYNFAGIHADEEVMDPARLKIKFRYKWLIVNLATAFLASFTVGLFEKTLETYVLLAVYMPIVAGMGGNAGTQTLAVMVRGIALKQVDFHNFMKPLIAELINGFVNGVINGILVFSIVMLINREFMIALVLSFAMVVNLLVAAFFGTIIPLIMKALGKDPASSATIFITTATDVLGFLAFLGLATILLK
jgi:magnesium transporter